MTAMSTNDLVVVTGALALYGKTDVAGAPALIPGEVAQVLAVDGTTTLVYGLDSEIDQWIDSASLTRLADIQDDTEVKWGDLLDPDFVHDYVWEGDDE